MNGELIGAPAPPTGHKKQRTYFRTLTILANQPRRSYVEVTPHRVIVDGEDRLVLPCNQSALVGRPGLRVAVAAGANITITIQDTMIFVILIHLYKNPAPFQRDHLGFYIANGTGLSEHCHGLLGRLGRASHINSHMTWGLAWVRGVLQVKWCPAQLCSLDSERLDSRHGGTWARGVQAALRYPCHSPGPHLSVPSWS